MRTNRVFRYALGWSALAILIAFDHWLFMTVFDATYLSWYIANGTLIGVVTVLVSLGIGNINDQTGLISSHPLDYFSTCLQIPGILLLAINVELESKDKRASLSLFDLLLMVIITFALIVLSFGWLIIITPLQFTVNLICGAPGRIFADSSGRLIGEIGTRKVKKVGKSEDTPKGWWEADLSSKSVTITNAIAALLFVFLKAIIN